MSSQLAIVTPLKKTPTLLPQSGRLILGSSPDRADMVFQSQGVADIHSVIARTKDGGWAIQDMGSEFGTMVDGKSVQVAKLAGGQTIHLASVVIKVVETAPNQQSTKETAPTKSRAPKTPSPELSPQRPEKRPNPPAKSSRNSILDIPGYSIQETLGKGGMGAVFRARQDRLNRDIALKVLSPRLAADAEFVSRFHREAQAVAALNHPNIVAVYDVGEAGGTHYIALEYMDANSLEELLAKEGRLPWRRVAELLLGAARGLTYAESKRIVHRDIKPSNLMLNSDDQVKISDLGLAHRDNEDSGDGKIYGTPHFIAPEQIRGSAVDRRCDIYSLGATGYQLLTGYTPFEGVNSREILRAVLTEDFAPIDSHLSGTPRELSTLIEKMIARDPDERPQSAESVVSRLEGILSGAASHSNGSSQASAPPVPKAKLAVVSLVIAAIAAAYHFTVKKEPALKQATETTEAPVGTVTGVTPTPPDNIQIVEGGESPEPQEVVSTPVEDDTAQKLFESEAEVEFLRLESSDLTLEDLRTKLIQLAEKYNGTTAAAKALAQAQIKAELIKQEKEAAMSLLTHRQAVIEKITQAAALDSAPTFPAKAFAAIRAVTGQDRLAQDEIFTKARSLLKTTICTKALAECTLIFEQVQRDITNADRAIPKRALEGLIARLQLGDMAVQHRPQGFEDLRRLEADARALLSDLDGYRERATTGAASADSASIANYCHGSSDAGLSAHLKSLRLDAAAARMRELQASLRSQAKGEEIGLIAAELELAAKVLNTLITDFPQWKRKIVTDPRPRRSSAEAASINEEGLTVATSEGSDLIRWTEFSNSPEALNNLFYKRLDRAWTQPERRGVALILNIAATLNSAEVITLAFSAPEKLKAKTSDAMLELFEYPEAWSLREESITHNRAAAAYLVKAIGFAANSEFGAAESSFLYISEEFPTSLLVMLLSDGTETSDTETGDTETGDTETGDTESNTNPSPDVEAPAAPNSPASPNGE